MSRPVLLGVSLVSLGLIMFVGVLASGLSQYQVGSSLNAESAIIFFVVSMSAILVVLIGIGILIYLFILKRQREKP